MAVHGRLSTVPIGKRDTIQIDLDQPEKGEVVVELYELDRSRSEFKDVTAEETADDLLATFTIRKDGKAPLVLEKLDLAKVTGKAFRKGAVFVSLRGGTEVHRIPIVHDIGEGEQDIEKHDVELGIIARTVDATYCSFKPDPKKVPPDPPLSSAALFSTKASGPVVTYILGLSSDAYFAQAEKYWNAGADEVVKPAAGSQGLSIEEVLESLSRGYSDTFKTGEYDTVNIVAHGTVGYITMALGKGSGPQPMNAADVVAWKKPKNYGLQRISSSTKIVFQGCRIGQDPCLLRALSKLFGGSPVYGCNYILSYGSHGDGGLATMDRLYEHLAVFKPGDVSTWTAKRDEMASALTAAHGAWKWPPAPAGSTDPHAAALARTASSWTTPPALYFDHSRQDNNYVDEKGKPIDHFEFITTVTDPATKTAKDADAKHGAEALKDAKAEVKGEGDGGKEGAELKRRKYEAHVLKIDPDTFEWTKSAKAGTKPGDWDIVVKGKRAEIAVRRVVAVDDKDPPTAAGSYQDNRKRTVLPRLDEPKHYTRSPEDNATAICPVNGATGCVLD